MIFLAFSLLLCFSGSVKCRSSTNKHDEMQDLVSSDPATILSWLNVEVREEVVVVEEEDVVGGGGGGLEVEVR